MRPSTRGIGGALPHVLLVAYVTSLSAPGFPFPGPRSASLAVAVLLGIALCVDREVEAAMR